MTRSFNKDNVIVSIENINNSIRLTLEDLKDQVQEQHENLLILKKYLDWQSRKPNRVFHPFKYKAWKLQGPPIPIEFM